MIGGDRVQVYGVLKPNVDPHDYEPSPADLEAIARRRRRRRERRRAGEVARATPIASAGPPGTIVDASTGVTRPRHGRRRTTAGDPHIWQNPRNAKIMVDQHRAGAWSPPTRPARRTYEANLARLHGPARRARRRTIAPQIATLTNKKLVTNHDAFGYYVDRYGLEFVGSIIPSFDTSGRAVRQPTSTTSSAQIKAAGVKAVFSESSLPPKTAEAIGQEAGVKVVDGDDALYGDTLGPAGSRRRHLPRDDAPQHEHDR